MTGTLENFLSQFGLQEINPELDESLHEIKTDDFKGWYIGSNKETKRGESYVTFTLGDFKSGERYSFINVPEKLDKNTKKEIQIERQRLNTLLHVQKEKKEKEASEEACRTYEEVQDYGTLPTYLKNKKINETFNCKTVKNSFGKINLLIPMQDVHGKMWGYQTIEESGDKQFFREQKITGLYFQFGSIDPQGVIFISEGFATSASIFLATGKTTLCAFSATNLKFVAEIIRENFKKISIVICGDDDRVKDINTGRIKAIEAALGAKAQVIFPTFHNDESRGSDFNDLHCEEGLEIVAAQLDTLKIFPPEEVIETEHSGFHKEIFVRGIPQLIPDIDGLRKYFERKNEYVSFDDSKSIYVWNGKFYEYFSDIKIAEFAEKHFDPKPNNKTVREFVEKVYRTRIKSSLWFQQTTQKKANFQNGYFDLVTKTFHPHSSTLGFLTVLPYDYDPGAGAEKFNQYLKDITMNDDTLVQVLLEFMGYALSNDSCWAQKALVLEGEGANGKSTFINIVREVLGQENCSALTLSQLQKETNRHLLEGKLANLAEETPNQRMMDSSTLKNLISGGIMQVRQLYKSPYFTKSRAKMIFACNDLPDGEDVTKAYLRRLIIVPFKATFDMEHGNVDPFIEEKLKEEFAGIFNLAISHYDNLCKSKQFTHSNKIDETMREYANYLDPLKDWVDEKINFYPVGNGCDEKVVSMRKLYDEYAIAMEQDNIRPLPRKKFTIQLRRKVPEFDARYASKRVDGKKERILKAISLETDG